MKICPTCFEQFDDDMNTCSKDGSVLQEASEAGGDKVEEPVPEAVSARADAESGKEPDVVGSKAGSRPAVSVSDEGPQPGGLQKAVVVLVVILALGAGLVFWKSKVGGHGASDLSRLSAEELQLLVKDFNPMQLKALADNPAQKKQLTDNLSQLLALAGEAKKEGVAAEPHVKAEIESMRMTLLARSYDTEINGDKGPMPPFGFISEDRVKEFWGEDKEATEEKNKSPNTNSNTNSNTAPVKKEDKKAQKPSKNSGIVVSALDVVGLGWIVGEADIRRHEAEFNSFIENKLELLRKAGQLGPDQEPTEEELKQARTSYAKTRIYYEEARAKIASISSMPNEEREKWEEFEKKFELQAKLQEAQFLVQTFVREKLAKRLEIGEDEVKKYIAAHPELTKKKEKKQEAERLLKKAKEGEDFAKLAEEFSDDPGSKSNGGLYEGISKGQFAPEFEKTALALEPGEIADKVVETDFGFHIIKLIKKGEAKGADGKPVPTFDARHILISTMVKDPDNPLAREMPVEQFVKAKLEREKQDEVLEDIKKNNPVRIAENFKVPEPSAEDIRRLREQQQLQLQQLQDAAGKDDGNDGDE